MIYSLIPAKKQSSRLPGKNTFGFMLGDKPLIAHTIEEILHLRTWNKHVRGPYVFTNEKNIKNTYGAEIIERPEIISDSKTTMKETVKEFIKIMKIKENDWILLTYLTCPFRKAERMQGAINAMHSFHMGNKSVQTISPVYYRPYGLMEQLGECNTGVFRCLQNQKNYYRKQNMPTLYRANGAIYIFVVSELEKLNDQMFNDNTFGLILDGIQGLDIDTELDFMLAEKILEKKKNEHIADKLSCSGRRETEHNTDWTRANIERIEEGRTQSFGFRY